MSYAPLPQFQYPTNAALDFRPLADGVNALAQMWQANRKSDQFNAALSQAGNIPGVRPEMLGLAKTLGPEHGPNALFQAYNAAQGRAQAQGQLAEQIRQHNSTIALQQQQLRLQQQTEARQGALTPYDIEIRKAEAANKQMDTDMMRGFGFGGPSPQPAQPPMPPQAMPGQAPPLPPMRGPAPLPQQNAPRSPLLMPGEAPNMLAPRPPLAGPQMQPQSGDGFDPSMVRPIADVAPQGPAAAPQAPPNTVRVMGRDMPVDDAQRMAMMFAMRGKGEAAKLIEKQIEQANLGKHTQDKIGEKALNSSELSARLEGIASKFKPEYQTIDMQAKMYGVSWMDAIGPLRDKIPQQARQKFEEYAAYRQEATDNLSRYIQEITGAAVGVQEEKRIRAGMPDPEKDSPMQFEAKLHNKIQQARYATARYNYLISQGYNASALSANKDKIEGLIKIDDMRDIMHKRGVAIKQQIMQQMPDMTDDRANDMTKQQVRKEFGI